MKELVQNAWGIVFEPPVRVNENLELIKNDKDVLGYFQVKYIEPLPQKVYDFGAIASGSTTGDIEITDLYMPDGELACYQIFPLDDMTLTVSQPKAKKRYATKNYVHIITPLTMQISPFQTRIFVWEDEKIFFDVKNPTRYERKRHRALYHGWRLILEKLPGKPPVVTTIPIEGA